MTIDYHINQRDELITFTVSGTVTTSEACVRIDELLNDDEFSPNLPQLVDLREAQIEGSKEDRQRFEQFLLGDYRPRLNASVAIVVNPEWDETTCAQAFWLSCALQRAELFDGWNQACKWLIKKEFTTSMADLDAITDSPDNDTQESARGDSCKKSGDSPGKGSDHQAEHSQ